MGFKWTRELSERLIYCVERYTCIYNFQSEEYLDREQKAQAFNNILEEMQKLVSTITLDEIKKRWANLRKQYLKEIKAIKLSQKSVPSLWCYGHLHFLSNHLNIDETKDNSDEKIIKIDGKIFENKCRICLEECVELNWNDFLYNNSQLTYKDCYYKYTRLEDIDGDNYSIMLCRNCSDCLESIEAFISKAIETHNALLQEFHSNITYKDQDDTDEHDKNNFEMIIVEETDTMSDLHDNANDEHFHEEFLEDIEKKETLIISKICDSSVTQTKTLRSRATRKKEKIKKKYKSSKQRTCCSICSKVLSSKYMARIHEEAHFKNRERNESCDECGLKFYTKSALTKHKLTHVDNREKTHKCEFCDKAFYNAGSLNVHRRIHLGKMIPCTICTKEFYRQAELDRHLFSHSATRINSDGKVRKVFFCCEICGENVRTSKYKVHNAKHMNKPLCKCLICNKEFFSRKSCVSHLRNYHKKNSEERNDYLITYKTNRCTSLYVQQNSLKLFVEE